MGCPAAPAHARVLYHESFERLPREWYIIPGAHSSWQTLELSSLSYGSAPPSLHMRMLPATLNYQLTSPAIPLEHLDADYTFQFRLRVVSPGSPLRIEVVVIDSSGQWLSRRAFLDLSGENQDSLRSYQFSFHGAERPGAGYCRLFVGLPYSKLYHEGEIWIDDVELRSGHEWAPPEIYLKPRSVEPGEVVGLHASCAATSATLTVYREGASRVPVHGPTSISGLSQQPVGPESWRTGAGWPVAASIPTEADWPSGVYIVHLDDGRVSVWAPFVVRGRGDEGPLLVILPTHTDQAYNDWGGRSFYSDPPSPEISFHRPTQSSFYSGPVHLVRFLEREGIGYAVASDDDLHHRPEILSRYSGVALTWHSEYWSRAMREGVEDYIATGGSILSFSGNTCWWQTRVEGDRLVCYKYEAGRDPCWRSDPALVTTHWDEPPLYDPPTRFLGLSWREGGMVNHETSSSCPCTWDWLSGHGGYTLDLPEHWVFAGVAPEDSARFGYPFAIVGYEVDGAPVRWVDGRPEFLPEGGTPDGFEILGHARCWNRYRADSAGVGLMCIRDFGSSFVFNGGTTGWCFGLPRDPAVQGVTRNLIRRLEQLPRGRRPAGRIEIFPNPTTERVQLRVTGEPRPGRFEIYSASGRLLGSSILHRTSALLLVDEAGDALPSGVYLIRVKGIGAARLVKLR